DRTGSFFDPADPGDERSEAGSWRIEPRGELRGNGEEQLVGAPSPQNPIEGILAQRRSQAGHRRRNGNAISLEDHARAGSAGESRCVHSKPVGYVYRRVRDLLAAQKTAEIDPGFRIPIGIEELPFLQTGESG